MKYCDQDPDPSTLLFAIRAIGYSFETAVADIVDNSISAEAKNVHIYYDPAGEPYFAFLDDGHGMDSSELKNALRVGSDRRGRPDSEVELGRYGLGLKSASFSQCRHFSVVSKQNSAVCAMTFDLDDVEASGKWRTRVLSQVEWRLIPEVSRLLNYGTGTLVVWQNFDKILNVTTRFEASFRKVVEQAKKHVEYVFHRFYDDVSIFFNENRVERRDPFLLESYGLQQQGRGIDKLLDGHKITITPFSLPYANSLTADEKQLLGNPKSIYDEQGLYLYRNRRLIAWGSWFRTEARSELNKLARVRVDIPSALDDMWQLDVKKSSAKIPDKLKEAINLAINDSVRRSRGAVAKPSVREAMAEHKVWDRRSVEGGSVEYSINRNNPLYATLKGMLKSEELSLFEEFVCEIEDFLPKFQIHIDQSTDKKISNGDALSGNERDLVSKLIGRVCRVDPEDREVLLDRYLAFETYMRLRPRRSELLKEIRHHG